MRQPTDLTGRHRRRLHDAVRDLGGGMSLWPLGVLFSFNFVDELDSAVFSALAPEIRSSFGLSDAGLTAIASLASALALVCSLPIGHLGDRSSRVRITRSAAAIWAAASVVAAGAWHVVVLAGARLVNGVGRTANLPVHSSLLADWYPRRSLGGVLATYTGASYAAAAAGPVVGFAGAHLGWRTTLALTAIPTVVVLVVSLRLREPLRGQQDGVASAEEAAARPPTDAATFAESRRRIFAVPTLRRLLVVAYVAGLAVFPLSTILSFHFERTFGAGPTLRGTVQLASGVGAGIGLVVGGALLHRWTNARGAVASVEVMAGGIGLFAIGALSVAWSPNALFALVATAVLGASSGCFYPALQALVASVAPPTARSQAYAWALFIAAAGGLSSFTISGIGEGLGYRVALSVLALIGFAATATAVTIRRYVAADVEAASEALAVASAARRAAEEERAVLHVAGLTVGFDGHPVLDGIDLAVRAGEVVAIVGTNGAGKSTLLDAVMGHVTPQRGSILFDGRDITYADPRQLAWLGAAHVPGGRSSLPDLLVEEHLRLAVWRHRDDTADADRRVQHALDRLPVVRNLLGRRAGDLSGGEQHLLAVAMAVVQRPRLLLLDELALGLSPSALDHVCELIEELRTQGCAVVVVDQSVELCSRIGTRAVFLERGTVRFDGPAVALADRHDLVRPVFLAGMEARADGEAVRPGSTDERALPPGLRIHRVTCTLGDHVVLRGVDLAVPFGQVTAISGPNGAGKTTLLDVVTGFVAADGGAVLLDGVDVTDWTAARRAAAGLGRTLQDGQLPPTLTVRATVALGFDRRLPFRSLTGEVLGLAPLRWQDADLRHRVDDLIAQLGLASWSDHPVGELSTGTRRLVQLAVVMAQRPSVLLLDEPSSGLAAAEVPMLAAALRTVVDDLRCATVLVEHDRAVVEAVADEMAVLDDGVLRSAAGDHEQRPARQGMGQT